MTRSRFYTAAGDLGDTARLGGDARLSRQLSIEAVGAVDGAVAAMAWRALAQDPATNEILSAVQAHLGCLMAHLSAMPELRGRYPGPDADDVAWLEERVAGFEAGLPPLRAFVQPGDSLSGAAFHVARTAVRRAERRVVGYAEIEPDIGVTSLVYLNRLSSLLFVMALHADQPD